MADATYIEPVKWQIVEKIIAKERPDAILPTMGGQTALNCALDLNRHGILEKYGVELIGAKCEAIDKAEDRELFDNAMVAIGLETPRHFMARSMEDAFAGLESIGFPCIIRPSLPWAAVAAASPTTVRVRRSVLAALSFLQPMNCSSMSRSLAGRNMKWRWSETRMTIA